MSTEEILNKLVSYKTVSGNFAETIELLDFADNLLTDCGFHVTRFVTKGYPSLLASTHKSNLKTPRICLASHVDVVKATDDLFKVKRTKEKLSGRGVFDMKFALAAYLNFVQQISSHVQDYDLGIMITSDEEIGGANGVRWLIDDYGYRPTFTILPDHGNHDFWNIEKSSRGIIDLRVVAKGKSGHSSRAWEGENAITKLGKYLYHLNEANFKYQGPTTSTFSINQIKGGLAPTLTQVPDYAEAYLDFRFKDQADRDLLMAEIHRLAKMYDVIIDEVLVDGPVHTVDLKNPFVRELTGTIEEVTRTKIGYVDAYGTTDARYFDNHALQCVVPGLPGGGHHGDDEWIDRKAIKQFDEVLRQYIEKVARYDTPFLTSRVKSTTIKEFRPETVASPKL
ncbi:MAG TPA: M20/M25/M40 family metallo-hydrolase [Candidatus Saccharimonadales bacterium]|nr:M20/M25/M40 family metallo-hydrolase [Candidatus Saccharimonadales bacterium]